MKTTLDISTTTRTYTFLLDNTPEGLMLYFPEYRPNLHDLDPTYRLTLYRWIPSGQVTVFQEDFKIDKSLACPRFRYEGNFYNQVLNFGKVLNLGDFYVSFNPIDEDGKYSNNFSGCQSVVFNSRQGVADIEMDRFEKGHLVAKLSDNFVDNIKMYYQGKLDVDIKSSVRFSIMTNNDIYYNLEWNPDEGGEVVYDGHYLRYDVKDFGDVESIIKNNNELWFDITNIPFKTHDDYINGLFAICVVTFTLDNGDPDAVLNIALRTNPFQLTPDRYARMLAASNNLLNIKVPKKMIYTKPRIASKTEQKIVKMTAETDSKSNIIQPVFFRTRELASLIIHPEVTENVCINLDAYKSQVDRFSLKIEGVVFTEIGRVEAGVIFKIRGNMLPGSKQIGTYYILNENNDLVTTGRYSYER